MNFIPAQVLDGGELETPFGNVRLPASRAVDLSDHEIVLLGARADAFEEASMASESVKESGLQFTEKLDVIEWLGNEQYAYVPYEAPDDIRQRLQDLERELDSESLRTQLVVSLDATSEFTEGSAADFVLDLRKVHIFAPESGENLTLRS